jgi:hypothetical protein
MAPFSLLHCVKPLCPTPSEIASVYVRIIYIFFKIIAAISTGLPIHGQQMKRPGLALVVVEAFLQFWALFCGPGKMAGSNGSRSRSITTTTTTRAPNSNTTTTTTKAMTMTMTPTTCPLEACLLLGHLQLGVRAGTIGMTLTHHYTQTLLSYISNTIPTPYYYYYYYYYYYGPLPAQFCHTFKKFSDNKA